MQSNVGAVYHFSFLVEACMKMFFYANPLSQNIMCKYMNEKIPVYANFCSSSVLLKSYSASVFSCNTHNDVEVKKKC